MTKDLGSFTGIRIGIATIKAFHDSLRIPCIGISSLETLSYNVKNPGLIVPILDCKNGNVYFGLYKHLSNNYEEIIPPSTDNIENIFNLIYEYLSSDINITFVGDGSIIYNDIIKEKVKNCNFLNDINQNNLNSLNLGLAGFYKYKNYNFEIDNNLLPLYLKKPQAQKQLEDKLNIDITYMNLCDLQKIKNNLSDDFDDFWNYNVFKSELESSNSKYLVAKINQEIVGFGGIKIIDNQADIMNIVTKKGKRNLGIGSSILKKLIELSKNLNLKALNLEVKDSNKIAILLYENFGFKKIAIRKNYYNKNDAFVMKKQIS